MKYYVAALFASLLIGSPLRAEETKKEEPQLTEQFIKLANTNWKGNLSKFKDACLQHQGKLKFDKDEPSPAKQWKCEFLLK